jgi:hypothetical protein
MSGQKRSGCALLVVGFVLGWVLATATRPHEAAYDPPASYEAPVQSDTAPRETLSPPPAVSEIAPLPAESIELLEEQSGRIVTESASQEFAQVPATPSGPSDEDIRSLIIEQSVASYSGSCPCPYNSDRAGRRCGGRSAYSRPGGAAPICYPSDVTDVDVQRFRSGLN